ncbi:NAD(P)H-dependent glycerol-3-phosphate dehydrogenase [Ignatzschineria sp. LJL83]
MSKKIAVIGAGSWGTALAIHLAAKHSVNLWSHNKEHVKEMQEVRLNERFLPEIPFPDSITLFDNFNEALKECDLILIVTPSTAFNEILTKLQDAHLETLPPIVSATKGLDHSNNGFLSDTFYQAFPNAHFTILSGPSFAKEVAKLYPTAIAIAGNNEEDLAEVIPFFHHDSMRVYGNLDMKGVQLAGAYKNVIAIATGISDGLGFGANARAALITRGLAEMTRLGIALQGKPETFQGLAGLGDLVLTATDNQSRNRRFGLYLGQGVKTTDAFEQVGQVVEGANIAKNIYELGEEMGIDLPIAQQVYRILHKNVLPHTSLKQLLAREQKTE